MSRAAVVIALSLWAGSAAAHPLAPALLELRQVGFETYDVLWRTSVTRAQRADVAPELPPTCAQRGALKTGLDGGDALIARWTAQCAGGLAGTTVGARGLDRSGINVILRIVHDDAREVNALLDATQPSLTLPAGPGKSVFAGYLALGIKHLLLGFDHLLFVIGLVLLLGVRLRRLAVTVTAFTLGHSVTLSMAALGLAAVDSATMELGIALSLLVLAVELARPGNAAPSLLGRHPAAMAGIFGLLHGLGFANALAEVGLPQQGIPLALFAFNLGIELGQLAVIIGLLALAALGQRLPHLHSPLIRTIPTYFIGSLAAFWCFERAAWFI